MEADRRIIIGISGASGVIFGIRLLQVLRTLDIKTHLIMSKAAELALSYETDMKANEVRALAARNYPVNDIAAPVSSGSFKTLGMILAPCSIRSMSEIATGATSSLLTRAADVTLKERRKLVLMVRETPLHAGHLRQMLHISEMGGIIAPPMPAFYSRPATIEDMIDHNVGRVLDLFDIDCGLVKRWGETESF